MTGPQRTAEEQASLLAIKKGLEKGEIRTFGELFRHCPEGSLGKQLDIPPARFAAKVANPGEYTYNEMIRFAALLQIDLSIIHKFITSQIKVADPAGPAASGA
jgi:hypothetical protein